MRITIETFCPLCGAEYKDFLPAKKIYAVLGHRPLNIFADIRCKKCKKTFPEKIAENWVG